MHIYGDYKQYKHARSETQIEMGLGLTHVNEPT